MSPNLPKNGFWGSEFQKSKSRFTNLFFQDAMCANFYLKRTTLTFLAQTWPKSKLGFEANVGIRISILEIPCVPMFRQNRQLWLFRLNLPKNGFCGRNFNNLSLDSASKPPIYHVCQFSVKMDNFWFPGINLGKLPNYVQYFGLNLLRILQRTGWRLKWAGWRWMKLGGSECTV